MISSKKIQFVVILILTYILLPIFAAEPNEPNEAKTVLKFENNIETMSWDIKIGETKEGESRYYRNPGDIKPTHVAKVMLHEDYPNYIYASSVMNTILDSSISKKFSKQQQEFFKTELAIRVDEPERIPFYYSTWLYATSQEDAQLMVQAYIEGLNMMVDERLDEFKRQISRFQQELDDAHKELPEKQKQLEDIEQNYQTVKKINHQFSTDGESSDLARNSIVEMDKTLNQLDIELAGLNARLRAIEEFRRNKPSAKLDEMFIELTIELRGLEARREITRHIRSREQEFISLYYERTNLKSEINRLNRTIDRNKELIDSYTNDLNERRKHPSLQPPKIYQNMATIYPVLIDN